MSDDLRKAADDYFSDRPDQAVKAYYDRNSRGTAIRLLARETGSEVADVRRAVEQSLGLASPLTFDEAKDLLSTLTPGEKSALRYRAPSAHPLMRHPDLVTEVYASTRGVEPETTARVEDLLAGITQNGRRFF